MSFSTTIARWCKKTPDHTVRLMRGVSIALFTSVIRDSPVDTGRLRSNWRCSIGEPNREEQSEVDKGGTPAVLEVLDQAKKLKGDGVIILTNSLPYAYRIEYEGWSHTKSPHGMVRRNMARVHNLLATQLRRGE